MPTTTRYRSSGCVTGLRVMPGTIRAPEAAVYTTCIPIAPCAERPRAVASLSVRSTSLAASDRGRRPALRTGITLDDLKGGNETSAPGGATLAVPEDAPAVPA